MKKTNKFIYWTPRGLSLVFILFLGLMSMDIFEGNYGIWDSLLGLFMHNITTLILLAVLIVSWRYEIVGAVVFILTGFLYIIFLAVRSFNSGFEGYYLIWALQISGIAFLIGALFLIGWFKTIG